MKKLILEIEKRLIDAGFSKRTNDDKGTTVPFFTLGEFNGGLISVELVGSPAKRANESSVLDMGLTALNFANDTHLLHAIRSKNQSRVSGKQLIKTVIVCEFKEVPKLDEEII